LRATGSRRAFIVRGADGLDEISPFGPTHVTELDAGAIVEKTIAPEDFGLRASAPGALDGGDAAENAKRIAAILGGQDDPARNAVARSARGAPVAAREDRPGAALRSAADEALECIRTARALKKLEEWKARLREAAPP